MPRETDKYANVLSANVTTAGVTVDSVEVNTGISLGEGYGMLIDQIDFQLDGSVLGDIYAGAAADYILSAWSTQSFDAVGDFAYSNSRLIHLQQAYRADFGTAGNAELIFQPREYKFDPPMILASPKLHLSVYATAAISGGKVYSRVYFRYVKLSTAEYLELAESFVLLN